jgi:two-component system, OmpR family, sensor histidine kinase PhoQ
VLLRRTLSLQARQLAAAGLALIAFLGVTGFALDRAFTEATLSATRERLQNLAFAYLGGIELSRRGELIPPDRSPDPRFERPGSGLYAGVAGEGLRWESASAMARELPFNDSFTPGTISFDGPLESGVGGVYRYGIGVAWEVEAGREVRFTLFVAEHAGVLAREVAIFRRTLWGYLGGGALLLLLIQIAVLRWSLRPLRRVAVELGRVERGEAERLVGDYPRELDLLTTNLNAFIVSEREQRDRYRNTLADLAHSLKTPLAVLRSRLESGSPEAELRDEVHSQVQRMSDIVSYQLSRAATSGHRVFAAPLRIDQRAEAIVQSLEKVYAAKNVLCEFELDPGARFYGEEGDLLELLGNLLENAFKWARHRVLLRVQAQTVAPQRRAGLLISVDDDGPGIPEDQVARLLQRGVRGDERVQGHGIGLSIVQDIVRAYHGELAVERSDELGGARFVLRFNPAL